LKNIFGELPMFTALILNGTYLVRLRNFRIVSLPSVVKLKFRKELFTVMPKKSNNKAAADASMWSFIERRRPSDELATQLTAEETR